MSISAGLSHACGLTRDGVAYCWGNGFRGQLGTGGVVYPATDSALRVAGNLNFVSLRAGPESTCGIVAGGDVYCWGGSEIEGESAAPRLVQGGLGFASLAYGGNFGGRGEACAQDNSRTIYCFGYEPHPLLSQPTPKVLMASGAGALQFDVGGSWLSELGAQYQTHACAVSSANTVACWGSNAEGQLGDGTTTARDSAATIPQLANVVQVTTGGVHSCAVTSIGAAYCWGQNREGQLGTGTFGAPVTTPQSVIGAVP